VPPDFLPFYIPLPGRQNSIRPFPKFF